MPQASAGANIVSTTQINDQVIETADIKDLAVTGAKIATGTITTDKFADSPLSAGQILMYGGATAPTGFLLCDASAVDRTTYATLFAVIGTTYGAGNGTTTFNVPDLRGRVPVGVGTGTGGGASGTGLPTGGTALTAVTRGGWKGEENHVLTVAELAAHSHNVVGYNNGTSGTRFAVAGGNTGAFTANPTDNAGNDTGHNTIQPVLGINFIIKT